MLSLPAKRLLLGLLRVAPRPIPVRELIAVGALFGVEANAIRVALTRLVARGLLVSDERGSYRMAPGADPVNRWVDAWRLGERRLRPWDGAWLCAWHPRGAGRGARARSHLALERLGFREGRDGLWVRPDNLRAERAALEADLVQQGLAAGALLFAGHGMPADAAAGWAASLWPCREIAAGHRRALRDLQRSAARLDRLDGGAALVETFLVGGAAIRSLARDPLLPDEIAPGEARRELTGAMRDYDRRGRAVWNRALDATALDGTPVHATALDGGP